MELNNSDEIRSLKEIVRFASDVYRGRQEMRYDDFLVRVIGGTVRKAVSQMLLGIKNRHQISTGNGRFVHYTTIFGLVSMLENSQGERKDFLRLYDSTHSNDPDEGHYLPRISDSKPNIELILNSPSHAYITSFLPAIVRGGSNNRDKLAFWRAYGDDGRGCSIEISLCTDLLFEVLYGKKKAEKTARILEVVYETQMPILHDTLRPLMKVGDDRNRQKTMEIIRRVISSEIDPISWLYKSEAYDYEKERRFVMTESEIQSRNGEVKFDYNGGVKGYEVAKHYYEHEALSTRKIFATNTTITLGPAVEDRYNLKLYIEYLLKRALLEGPTVTQSDIQYRGRYPQDH